MIITPSAITALFTGYQKAVSRRFQKGYHIPCGRRIATQIPSTTKSNTYGWLGKWPNIP